MELEAYRCLTCNEPLTLTPSIADDPAVQQYDAVCLKCAMPYIIRPDED